MKANRRLKGYTVIENLAIIVVIALIVGISVIAYSEALDSSLQSNLVNASIELKIFQAENNKFPETIDCNRSDSTTNKCIKTSLGVMLTYQVNNSSNPQTFELYDTNGFSTYRITSHSQLKKM